LRVAPRILSTTRLLPVVALVVHAVLTHPDALVDVVGEVVVAEV
jgi:hypothetical protein